MAKKILNSFVGVAGEEENEKEGEGGGNHLTSKTL
jgi:hypothetical protein